MNWLGAGLAGVFAAVLGAVVGALAHVEARRHGIDLPLVVGLVAGLAAAFVSIRRSGLRGVLVASLAIWAAALAEVIAEPSRGLLHDLFAFHERLAPGRAVAYAVTFVLTVYVASRARPAASPAACARPTGR